MNIEAGLGKILDLLTKRSVVAGDCPLKSSMPYTLTVVNKGLTSYKNNNITYAAYALGFATRACIGFGVFTKEELEEINQATLSSRKKKE